MKEFLGHVCMLHFIVRMKLILKIFLLFIRRYIKFCLSCSTTLNEVNSLLLNNNIWKQRLMNVGTYSMQDAIKWGLTGVMLRSTGVKRDLRLDLYETYANYYYLNFKSFYSKHGDSYDRYLLRMNEMFESLIIINQVINKLINNYKFINKNKLINLNNLNSYNNKNSFITMESTIKHFKYWSEGFIVKNNLIYSAVESAKGEFGVTLIANSNNKTL